MQTTAMLDPDPNTMLDIAEQTLHASAPNAYATALAAIYHPGSRTLHMASAGHPGPVLRHPDGRIEHLAVHGMMMGVEAEGMRTPVAVPIVPGSLLVFFTDGLVEITHDIDEGFSRCKLR